MKNNTNSTFNVSTSTIGTNGTNGTTSSYGILSSGSTSTSTTNTIISYNGANYFYTNKKMYNILGTDLELDSDISLGIVIALINTLGYEIYDNIKNQCELPIELVNLMENKRVQYNRQKNIDKLLK